MCERYTIHCGIPPIQNTQIDRDEAARCIISVSCPTDLDDCVVVGDRVGVFLEHVHKSETASKRLTRGFPVVSLDFTCLLDLTVSTTTAATLT